ncbi:MAG: nuclear transport factor 2 family protein [Pseudomonadota bacterium]
MIRIFVILLIFLAQPGGAEDLRVPQEVLQANREFYRAFRESDLPAMEALWAVGLPVAVQHPSTGLITGRANVLASWRAMMRAPPDIRCEIEAVMHGDGKWGIICLELLNPGSVRMINVFDQENGVWKMTFHGPAPHQDRTS